ncbi:MarR family winged helix-turn-helix transcriptional regulator [Niabella drilacis]|uniref:DNA-binding transcriptional regulator, MarR family n=1 Tax=Niabella drilacis (strain DSM 25811 / CCM 8410 / CCUG 62505 / LMG 26954 / E90) TaxID=1285928 RepID=A0A1G6XV78_NIADE|nr:MarR family transcriptional regulator [Niabella drilacis]SDD81325.1 DNA-binding transcriptional regulator, MarR family [Niabella drilacis]
MQPSATEDFSELGRELSDATILMHEAIARSAGLTGVDHKYLSLILRQGPLTAGELSNHTGLTTGAVTAMIDRLEAQQLVSREFDKTDRRKVLIVANKAKAKKLFERSNQRLKTEVEKLISTYSKKDVQLIAGYLRASVGIMKAFTNELNNNAK